MYTTSKTQHSSVQQLRKALRLHSLWWKSKLLHPKKHDKYQEKRVCETPSGYSYKPFDDYKAIFIHIPKCAGVSVNKTLFGNLAGGHATIEDYARIFEPKKFEEYFKFTIVRNPWDRLLSAYLFLKRGGFNERDRKWAERELFGIETFEQFVMEWVNEQNIWKWHHLRPQLFYIMDKSGLLKPDFIGYFENITYDFNLITKKIGINSTLPHENFTSHDEYTNHYTTDMKIKIQRIYHHDITELGYDFENSKIETKLKTRAMT